MTEKIATVLYEAYVILQNAREPEIFAQLARFGVDVALLDEGMVLYEEAVRLNSAQASIYGEQFGATDALKARWAEVDHVYRFHRRAAKRTFKEKRM